MQNKSCMFEIRGSRPAARIQQAILSVDRNNKPTEVWFRETLLAAWVATCIEARDDISMGDIVRAESCASGHVDWISKFPLYCEDLIDKKKKGKT